LENRNFVFRKKDDMLSFGAYALNVAWVSML
jgi:hypothetical protein